METISAAPEPVSPTFLPPTIPRVLSVDVLRGLVMFTMVFVNDSAGSETFPWWACHWSEIRGPHGPSGMTFVDVVFPSFLFITGMSIPLAVESRRRKGASWLTIATHILLRTLSLLFLGVLMVNEEDGVGTNLIHWRPYVWETLLFVSAILAFLIVPTRSRRGRIMLNTVRVAGGAGLIFLALIFQNPQGHHILFRNQSGQLVFHHVWWGILGLIGWSYLVVCCSAIPLRFNRSFMILTMFVLSSCYGAERAGMFDGLRIQHWVELGGTLGSHGSIAMAGAILGTLLRRESQITRPAERIRWASGFAICLALLGWLTVGSFGISKNDATPAWCYFSAAIACALWTILYAIIDVAGWRKWSLPLAWAGGSALLIYFLQPLSYALFRLVQTDWYDNLGVGATAWPGVARAATTAALLCLIGGLLYRKRVMLKL